MKKIQNFFKICVISLICLFSIKCYDNTALNQPLVANKTVALKKFGDVIGLPSNGKFLICLKNHILQTRKIHSGQILNSFENISGNVVCLSKNGKYLVFSPMLKRITLFNIEDSKELLKIDLKESCFLFDAHLVTRLSENGNILVISNSYTDHFEIWNLKKRKKICILKDFESGIYWFDFSFNGKYLAVSSKFGSLAIYDIKTKKKYMFIHYKKAKNVTRGIVNFSKDGKFLAVGIGSKVEIWNVRKKKLYLRFKSFSKKIYALNFDFSGNKLAILGKEVSIFDVTKNKKILSFKLEDFDIYSSPTSTKIVFAQKSKKLYIIYPQNKSLSSESKGEYVLKIYDLEKLLGSSNR